MPAPSLPTPSEFDFELELERAKWLRRRFIIFCIFSLVVTIPAEIPTLIQLSQPGRAFYAALVSLFGSLVCCALYIAALIYAKRTLPSQQTILNLAYWLVVSVGCFSLLYMRIALEVDPVSATEEPDVNAPLAWMFAAPFIIFLSHCLTCVFIPWTVRESFRAAIPGLILNAAIIGLDMLLRRTGLWGLLSALATFLAILPGLAICWWRYSRFHEKFKLRFESSRYRQLLNDMAGARRIHESFLPPPRQSGPVQLNYIYEPMRQIGGDLLFVHPGPDPDPGTNDSPTLSAVLLDVTGHGIAAALTGNRILGELERIFAENPHASPAQVLSALNHYVCLTLSRHSMYVTAICLKADTTNNTLLFASGGHPTAFLRRADGQIHPLESTTTLLGIIDGPDYSPDQLELPFLPGDSLLAYTDGAPDARNRLGQSLRISGVQSLLLQSSSSNPDPANWPLAMLNHISSHRNAPPEDDTLILTLHRPMVPSQSTPAASPHRHADPAGMAQRSRMMNLENPA